MKKSDEKIKYVEEEETETTETTEELTVDDLIEKLATMQQREKEAVAKAQEMTDMAQRLQAEFDNYRKRTNENSRKAREDGTIEVLSKILPLTDVIAQAMAMISDETVKKGVSMIEGEITKILAQYGITEIEAEGKEFDPRYHEAIMQTPAKSEEEKDTVATVFQKGYIMGEKVIRPARVIVNK